MLSQSDWKGFWPERTRTVEGVELLVEGVGEGSEAVAIVGRRILHSALIGGRRRRRKRRRKRGGILISVERGEGVACQGGWPKLGL